MARRPRAAWRVLLLLPLALAPAVGSAAEVDRFVPEGTAKRVRQVTASFSEPMVPVGDPRGSESPFDVGCVAPGAGRWVDSRTWVHDFDRELPAGVRCLFTLRPGLRSLAGDPVGGRREFVFSTGGPAIVTSTPADGDLEIDEEQAFVLALDGEPAEASVLASAAFAVEGLPDRVGVRILAGRERQAALRANPEYARLPPATVLVLAPRQRFPSGARVTLVWGSGIATASAVLTERDQLLRFRVRAPFTATFRCERESREAGCIPVTPMAVEFSAAVPWSRARQAALVADDGRRLPPAGGPEAPGALVWRIAWTGPFAESTPFRVELPADLRDDAGRPLQNARAFPLTVRTESFPPLAKFAARFGIVEAADPVLPVTLRNLEPGVQARLLRVDQKPGGGHAGFLGFVRGTLLRIPPDHSPEILPWLRKVGRADRETSVFAAPAPGAPEGTPAAAPGAVQAVALPRPNGAQAFEVVGIPLGQPGLYVVELESARLGASLLGKAKPLHVPTAALVTNLAVHLLWGREASLAWVTTLDTGRPVPGSRVTVYDCRGAQLWQGRTDGQGIARVGRLPERAALARCALPARPGPFFDHAQTTALDGLDGGLFVVAQTLEDLTFVHSSWDRGIEPWRFQLPEPGDEGPVSVHTILDRALFRAGETVSMKHVIRAQTLAGFGRLAASERPTRLSIRHQGSAERYDLPLEWDAGGVATSAWRIPREARLGRYDVVLVRPAPPSPAAAAATPERAEEAGESEAEGDREWLSGRFRVEEFRVPSMKGLIQPPAAPMIAASELPLDLGVQYLAGGPAGRQPVVLRAQVRRHDVDLGDAWEGFTFANGAVTEGIVRRGRGGDAERGDAAGDGAGEPGGDAPARPAIHQREDLRLDAAGTARAIVGHLPRSATPLEVLAELEFRDPSGDAQTVAATVPLWPGQWLVGLKPDDWVASRERVRATVAVVDVAGQPVTGAPVRVDLLEEKSYSHRTRLVGGFYAYEHVVETRRTGELCRGVTGPGGLLPCEGPAPAAGSVVLQATVTDPAGRATAAHQSVWVAGTEDWWFEVRDHDRMDLLPERRRYEPGETARFQVRMPFREATALVALEREGVQEAWVTTLSGKEPVIEVPVTGAHAPNMFVSVLAVRGRVGGAEPTATVDLGRPAFKLGIAEIRVGWRARELKVDVQAERPVYRVRETARVRIAVRTADGHAPPRGSEVAVAAVDEGLLELAPNPSWRLLEAMMGRRGYQVATATAQMQVVGKRHFGLKAVAQGGGGGRSATRELFDTLLLWRARVPLDGRGAATIEVPLSDALTSFRIVAVATGGDDLFGTGSTSIRSTQDLMVLPGIAPLVREGDRFRAEVTLRNTTARPMAVTVRGRVQGLPDALAPRPVPLGPGEARAVGWELTAPPAAGTLVYELEASEPAGPTDRIRVSQRVAAATPVRTYQATLRQWDGPLRQAVQRPPGALPGQGGVEVTLVPTLADGLASVRDWMRRYPYTCLEQRVSRAVALRDAGLWREVVATLPGYVDGDGFLKYFAPMREGSEVLTAYVLAVSHEAGLALPDDVRDRLLAALRGFVEGTVRTRFALATTDLSVRKLVALEALSRYGKAEAKLLGSVAVEPALWPTSAVLDWWSVLSRVPDAPARARHLQEAEQTLRTRLTLAGSTLGFSTESRDGLWWLMVSPDVNAARLLLSLLETGAWRDDLPRLLRGALARQRRGAWDLTVANAWGTLAVEKFSRAFEQDRVTGTTTGMLAAGGSAPAPGTAPAVDWSRTPSGGTLAFPWPAGPAELSVDHAGTGRPWVTVSSRAAVPLAAPLASGFRIERKLLPVDGSDPARLRRGDLIRVRLDIDAQTDMTWVVVDDPVPPGASHVGTGLGGDSTLAAAPAAGPASTRPPGFARLAFEERGFEAFRAYYAFVPRGRWTVEYALRLNQAGRFRLPATRVEALYAPEVFGERPNPALEVRE